MPRVRIECKQAIYDSLPSTRLELVQKLGITQKVVENNLRDMVREGLCHKSPVRIPKPGTDSTKRTHVLYVQGKAAPKVEKPFNRDLLQRKRQDEPLHDVRVDPTVNLYRDPLNAMFGM